MASAPSQICPSCGARLPAGAEVCDLCGTEVAAAPEKALQDAASAKEQKKEAAAGEGVFCNECGWRNPPGAKYCSQCGARLQSARAARPAPPPSAAARSQHVDADGDARPEAPTPSTDAGAAKQMGLLVGAAVLAVAALFVITTLSEGAGSDASPGEEQAAATEGAPNAAPGNAPAAAAPSTPRELIAAVKAAPLPEAIAAPADSLQAVVARAKGEGRVEAQRRLADLYVGAGAIGRAAIAQREIAEATGQPEDWERAASRLYDWMAAAEGEPRFVIADLTAEAYERVVAERPDDLGLRTNMAMAYLASRANPMRGIEEVKGVLEEDPDHVQALFVYGYALAQIGRTDQAIAQFERARTAAGDGSPRAEQATQIIETLRQAGSSPGSG